MALQPGHLVIVFDVPESRAAPFKVHSRCNWRAAWSPGALSNLLRSAVWAEEERWGGLRLHTRIRTASMDLPADLVFVLKCSNCVD